MLIAAFLRTSTVRRILTLSLIEFYAPEFLWGEIDRHLPELAKKAALSAASAAELVKLLEGYVAPIPSEALRPHWERAARAMRRIDPRDAACVAAALAVPCDGIWSDDHHLKAQGIVRCWTTPELVAALREAGLKF